LLATQLQVLLMQKVISQVIAQGMDQLDAQETLYRTTQL
jgi:hypothetical protein